jgi:hypothetical protein
MPFSLVLFRYLWPFWLFRDASHGDRLARAAAYRHNRGMRIYLPGYLMRWTISSIVLLVCTMSLGAHSTPSAAGPPDFFALMAAGSGVLFASCICIMFVTAYVYFYLSRHDA